MTEEQFIAELMKRGAVFVFGSNLAGRHGAGAARTARDKYGAVLGKGDGHYGQSYAIPTKDALLRPLDLLAIRQYVETFLAYARAHPELTFAVTAVGCGLAGYSAVEIAPMFTDAPGNCVLPAGWRR